MSSSPLGPQWESQPPQPQQPPPAPAAGASTSAAAPPPVTGDALQFDKVEFQRGGEQPSVTACANCHQPITGAYFAAGEHVVCPACRDQIVASMTGGSGAARFFKAGAFGVLAAVAGGLLWFGIRKATGYEIGLIAIVVGLGVGAAVRKGSDGRGGILYQLLAVFLTYTCIVSTYVPEVLEAMQKESGDAPFAFVFVVSVVVAFLAPVLAGFQNIIGMLIIAFALWEAWKMNKRQVVEFTGPHMLGPGGAIPQQQHQQPPPPPPMMPTAGAR